mgnify:CR=1 FL=1
MSYGTNLIRNKIHILRFPIKIEVKFSDPSIPDLQEETGWWDKNRIVIYSKLAPIKKFGVFVHEFVEWLLEGNLKLPHNIAHNLANIIERIFTLNQPEEQLWEKWR